ncbi:hypothetical protein BLOT_004013 [Blomia tropicalis]|nr:hypothetical protein BLOT_004013 [Blomia tropicalis]
MGSILSKLFGGGSSNHGNHSTDAPLAILPPPQSQLNATGSLKSNSRPTSPQHPSTPEASPLPINVLEVEVDEEAFKEVVPIVYTSTIKAQIDQSPPHPLELQKSAPIATLDSDYEDDLVQSFENAEIEEAAIKIQAGVRGYLTRKQIHANKCQKPQSSQTVSNTSTDNILPPPESFNSIQKPDLIQSTLISVPSSPLKTKRIETPVPRSPPFAQDDTNYSILDVDELPTQLSTLTSNEELEIFKKINEINQLLSTNDCEEIEIVPEPPISTMSNLQSSLIGLSSTSINNVLNELDKTLNEQEKSLEAEIDNDVQVIQPAFNLTLDEKKPEPQENPSVLVKAPSIDADEEKTSSQMEESQLSEEAAAIRIQAAFRGYEVRKSLSRDPSPAPEKFDHSENNESSIVDEPKETQNLLSFEENVKSETKEDESPENGKETNDLKIEKDLNVESNSENCEIKLPEIVDTQIEKPTLEVSTENDFPTQSNSEELINLSENSLAENIDKQNEEPTLDVHQKLLSGDVASDRVVVVHEADEEPKTDKVSVDIESSIKELEVLEADYVDIMQLIANSLEQQKSFDRDLLADPKEAELDDSMEIQIELSTPSGEQSATDTVQVQQPSKIPVPERPSSVTGKSILKEPSSPEPHVRIMIYGIN